MKNYAFLRYFSSHLNRCYIVAVVGSDYEDVCKYLHFDFTPLSVPCKKK